MTGKFSVGEITMLLRMRGWCGGIILCLLAAGPVAAVDYTWNGSSTPVGGQWTNAANWSPGTGYPSQPTDRAIFSSAISNCTLTQPVTIAELRVESSYSGTVSLLLDGAITAGTIVLQGGILISGTERVTAQNSLQVGGGKSSDITCLGNASVTAGIIGILRMRGASAQLNGSSAAEQTLASLLVPSGRCTLTRNFIAAHLQVDPGAALVLGTPSSLTVTTHSIGGTLKAEKESALVFLSGASISGTLDASVAGSAITCNGNWAVPGTFLPSGNLTNALLVIQSSGGTVHHGSNAADLVAIQNAAGQKTVWNSSNTIQQLTVSAGTTLEIAAGAVLSVPGAIANAGTIMETAPGFIRHEADSLEAVSENLIPLRELKVRNAFRVMLRDADEALQVAANDTAAGIQVRNMRNGDTLSLSATETLLASTIFLTAEIPTQNAAAAAADGTLQAVPGDTLTVSYADNEDPADSRKTTSLSVVLSVVSTTLPPVSSTTTTTVTTTTLATSTSLRPSTTTTTGIPSSTSTSSTSTTSSTGGSTTSTTLPAAGGPSVLLEFAQFAAGSGYQSFLLLTNPGSASASAAVSFRSPEGLPQPLLVNGQAASSQTVLLAARGSARLLLQSPDGRLISGWCRVTASQPIGGVLIYQWVDGSTLLAEASVLPSPRMRRFSLPIPQLNARSDTGLAVANTGDQEAVLTGRFFSSSGVLLGETTLPLPPGKQVAQFTGQLFPAVPAAAEGSIEISSGRDVIVVGLLYQGGIFTTLPVLNLTQ